MDIYKQAENIGNQEEFVDFLKSLKENYKKNSDEWENNDLTNFLEGLIGYSIDKPQASSSWKVFAEILLAARVYE